MDIIGDIVRDHEGQSDTDSDNDENICRTPTKSSPQKSPLKLSSVLKRKRRLSLSEPGPSQDFRQESSSGLQPGKLVSYSDDSEGEDDDDLEEDGDREDEDEECMIEQSRAVTASSKKTDFVFKEPSFRKKQFTFHPFKSVDGVLSPDTDNKDDQVTVTIPEQLGNNLTTKINMKRLYVNFCSRQLWSVYLAVCPCSSLVFLAQSESVQKQENSGARSRNLTARNTFSQGEDKTLI